MKPFALGAWLVGFAEPIDWQSAHAGHRYILQQFVCTAPVKAEWDRQRHGYLHPRQWELEVQSHIRDLKPPVAKGSALLLGLRENRLVAMSHYGFDSSTDQFLIWAVARAVDTCGEGLGDELIAKTMYHLRQTKVNELLDCGVFTRIDRRNKASQAAFERAGFESLGAAPGDDYLEMWVHALDLDQER